MTTKTRQPFTKKQHRVVGLILATFRDRVLSRAVVELSASYGPNSRETRAAVAALNSVDRLRCVLDDAACNEDTDPTSKPAALYYPSIEQRAVAAEELNIDWGAD